jgi:hypothetical protein
MPSAYAKIISEFVHFFYFIYMCTILCLYGHLDCCETNFLPNFRDGERKLSLLSWEFLTFLVAKAYNQPCVGPKSSMYGELCITRTAE